MSDLIAAIASGSALAAIGVLRLSGPGAAEAVGRVFTPHSGRPLTETEDRRLVLGTLRGPDGGVIDECLCTVSRAPHSYTGEDTAELQCHGSPTVLRLALEALFQAGARQALPGEFTKRAFLNGRMDLVGAEAVIDLIEAESAAAAKNAAGQLGGAMSRRIAAVYDALADMLSHFQAVVDYPDEGVEPVELDRFAAQLAQAGDDLQRLLDSYGNGRVLNRGVPAVLLGSPNVGKSSLLNALLGYDRAIVTAQPGTTRDTVSERVELGGLLLRLTDTAGLRSTADAVEQLGIERARAAAQEAELALVLVEAGSAGAEDWEILRSVQNVPHVLLVRTKSDLYPDAAPLQPPAGLRFDAQLAVSSKTGAGLRELGETTAALFPTGDVPPGEILTNARQAEAVTRAVEALRGAETALRSGIAPDAALSDVEGAMAALGELTGRTVREDVTARIFERFCVGK